MKQTASLLLCLLTPAFAEVEAVADPFSKRQDANTVVWSPLFQATWDELNAYMGGKPKKLSGPNALMSRLDNFEWDAGSVLPKDYWKTWAGPSTHEFLNQVNKEAAALTGEAKGPFRLEYANPSSVAAFGLLDRTVQFKKAFFRSRKQPLFFGKDKQPVQFFGVQGEESDDFRDSVRVLAYRPKDGSHALEVACKGSDDLLIIYKPAKPMEFATACKWLREWRQTHKQNAGDYGTWNDGYLHGRDQVRIPYITLNHKTDFAEKLSTGRNYDKPGDPWVIERAEQVTLFELTETGARVRVEVSTEMAPFGGTPIDPTPRKFIYDRPFFAFLWRKHADWPYIGVWVGDSSALLKME